MAAIEGHHLRFSLNHCPSADGGCLTIRCRDSGEGFDYRHLMAERPDDHQYAGRGIMLLRQLSTSLRFLGKGNEVEVVYDWQYG